MSLHVEPVSHQPDRQPEPEHPERCRDAQREGRAAHEALRREGGLDASGIAHDGIEGRLIDSGTHTQQLFDPALNVLHPEKAQDARQRRVALELMAHHAGGVDAGDGADHPHEADEAAKEYRLPERHVVPRKCLPELRQHPRQLVEQVYLRHHQDGQNAEGEARRKDAAYAPHRARDELCTHELSLRHRQGMHQIALPAQQVGVKPPYDGHDGNDCRADEDRRVRKTQQAHGGRIGVAVCAVPAPDRGTKQHRHRQQSQIQPAVGTGCGPELMFQ